MKTVTLIMAVLALCAGCDVAATLPSQPRAPSVMIGLSAAECSEFDWPTTLRGVPSTCRVLWCEVGIWDQKAGGPAVLGCWSTGAQP